MILSDRTIREEIAAGRITIDPFDDAAIQPSSVDLRLDRHFRVFLNHTMSVIDVREDLRDLTELVEIADGEAFILHPGEFVLGSTYERVGLPDDVVARIEGKSSLGRLGLLIHSSLPASEQLLVLDDKGLVLRTIVEIVKEPRPCKVVSFDPNTFEVSYHDVTGCFEGPADRIFEVRLASGRSVRVTAGHNLFTLDTSGELRKVRTAELDAGLLVAVPRSIPEPANPRNQIAVLSFVPEREHYRLCFEGPSVARRFQDGWSEVSELLKQHGYSPSYYRRRSRLPWQVAAELPGLIDGLGPADRVSGRAERHTIPAVIEVDADIAWMLGMYVAEGYRRYKQLVISNNDQARLDRLEATFHRLGLPLYRSAGAVTCCSRLVSDLFGWLGMGGKAPTKRLPPMVFGWPDNLLQSFHDGLVDGDGSIAGGRTSIWTTSVGLVSDALLMSARLGRRAACSRKVTKTLPLWQVYAPDREHKLLTSLPLPDDLLRRVRSAAQLDQTQASRLAGYRHSTSLSNIENRSNRDAVHVATLRRLRDVYAAHGVAPDMLQRMSRLVDGGLAWDRVVEVVDTGEYESIYDVEVRPSGRKIENFLAGSGGVFVANTAGFIDAGFNGHLTLELSNVANLPITLYPGMKIGQVSFLKMTTPADVPYGSAELGSKYQHQRGPTPSRYFENLTGRGHQ